MRRHSYPKTSRILESCSILILCISLMLCHDKQKDKSYFGGSEVSSPSKRHIRQGGVGTVGATSCSKTTSAAGRRRREKKRIRLIKQTPLLFLSIDMKKYCSSAPSQEMLNKQKKLTADSLYNTQKVTCLGKRKDLITP